MGNQVAGKVPNRQARASMLGLEPLEARCVPAGILGPLPSPPSPPEDFSNRLWFDAKGRIPSYEVERLNAPSYQGIGGIPIHDPEEGDGPFVSANSIEQVDLIKNHMESVFGKNPFAPVDSNKTPIEDDLKNDLVLTGSARATTFIDIPIPLKSSPSDTIAAEIIRGNKSAQFEDMDFRLTLDHPSPQQLVAFLLIPTNSGTRVEKLFRQPGESDFSGVPNGLQNIILDADAPQSPGAEITSGFRYRFTKSDNDQIDYTKGEATKLTLVIVDFVPSLREARGVVRDFKVGIQFKRLTAETIFTNNPALSGNLSRTFLPFGAGRQLAKGTLSQLAATTTTFEFTPTEMNLFQIDRTGLGQFPFSFSPVVVVDASGHPVSPEPLKGETQQFLLKNDETYRIQITVNPKPNSTLGGPAEFLVDIRQKGKFLLASNPFDWSESGRATQAEPDAFRFSPSISAIYEIAVSNPLARPNLFSSDGVSISPLPGPPLRYALDSGKEYLCVVGSSASTKNSGGFSITAKCVHDSPAPILLCQTIPIEIKSPGHRPLVPFVMPHDGDVEISYRSDDPNLLDTFLVIRNMPGDNSPSPRIAPFVSGFDDNSAVFDPSNMTRNRDASVRLKLKGGETVFIECRGKRGFTGMGHLSVIPLPETETVDNTTTAREVEFLPLRNGFRGTTTGYIGFAGDATRRGDVDVFRFKAPQSGTFTLNIIPENDPAKNNALAFEAVVLGQDGERLCGNILVDGPRPNFDQLELVEGHTYYISISANGDAPLANQAGHYRMVVESARASAGSFNSTGPGRFLLAGPILAETSQLGTFVPFASGLISVNSTRLLADASIPAKNLDFEVRRDGVTVARSANGVVDSLPVETDASYDFYTASSQRSQQQAPAPVSKASFALDLQFSLPPPPPTVAPLPNTNEKQVSIALNDPAFLRVVLVTVLTGPVMEPVATLPEQPLTPPAGETESVPVAGVFSETRLAFAEQEILQGAALDIIASGAIDQLAIFAGKGPTDMPPEFWRLVAWAADGVSQAHQGFPVISSRLLALGEGSMSAIAKLMEGLPPTLGESAGRTPTTMELVADAVFLPAEPTGIFIAQPRFRRHWLEAAIVIISSAGATALAWPPRRDRDKTNPLQADGYIWN